MHFPGEWSVCSSVPGSGQGSGSGAREEQRQWWSHSDRPSSRCLRNSHHCPPGSWAQVTYTCRMTVQTSPLLAEFLWIMSVCFNRRRGGKYAVGSACIGGGQGIAIILEKCWRRQGKKKQRTNSRQESCLLKSHIAFQTHNKLLKHTH